MLYLHAMRHYADVRGRSRRIDFIEFLLVFFLLTMVTAVIDRMRAGQYGRDDHLLTLLVTAVHLTPFCALAARRSHDINRSGWLALIGLVPIVGYAMMLIWGVVGSSGPNRFGPEAGSRVQVEPSFKLALTEETAIAAGAAPEVLVPEFRRLSAETVAVVGPIETVTPTKQAQGLNPLAIVDELERLAHLRFIEAITDEEFDHLKVRALAQWVR